MFNQLIEFDLIIYFTEAWTFFSSEFFENEINNFEDKRKELKKIIKKKVMKKARNERPFKRKVGGKSLSGQKKNFKRRKLH